MIQTGDDYFDSSEFSDLLSAYEESVNAGHPVFMDVDELVDIADYYDLIGHHEKATQAIDTALTLDPRATLPLAFKAREALDEGNVKAANDYVNEIDDRDDLEYVYIKAEILVAQDLIDDADAMLNDALESLAMEERDGFILDVANMYLEYGVYDTALDWLKRSKDKKDRDYCDAVARTEIGLGDYASAIKRYEKLLETYPYSKKFWNTLANAQFLNEQYNDGVTSCEYALAIDPNYASAMLTKANCLSKLGNYETAHEYYERYFKVMPHEAYAEYCVGNSYLNLADYNQALTHLEKAAQMAKPTNNRELTQIYESLALVYSGLNLPDKAMECMEKVKSLQDGDPDGDSTAEQSVMKGHIMLENGQKDEAEAMFRNALAESDNSPEIMLQVIVSIFDNGYTEVAYNMFKLFFDALDNNYPNGYSYMAMCCWDLKRYAEFMHYFSIALERAPDEARIVLSTIIPANVSARDFFTDMLNKIKEDQQ